MAIKVIKKIGLSSAIFLIAAVFMGTSFFAAADTGGVYRAVAKSTAPAEGDLSLPPQELLTRAIESCAELNSYQCRLKLRLTKGDRVQNSEYVFFYKKPNLIRMHVENGKDKGSTVILRKDGCIRGRREGFLSMFAITLKPDDDRLFDLWDRSFCESDWVTLLTETRDRLADVKDNRLELTEGGRQILLETKGADFVERTWLDRDSLLLLKKQARRNNGDFLEAAWSEIALNPLFGNDFFYF